MECNEMVISLIAEWFDPQRKEVKKFLVKYYRGKNEVEMRDASSGRQFLKKTPIPTASMTSLSSPLSSSGISSITEQDFNVGRHVVLLSRNLKFVEYGDDETRKKLEGSRQRTVLLIPHHCSNQSVIADVVDLMESNHLSVVGMKAIPMEELRNNTSSFQVGNTLSNGDSVVAVSFEGRDSIAKAKKLSESHFAQKIYCSANASEAAKAHDVFLKNNNLPCNDENCDNILSSETDTGDCTCTCTVIKPHAVKARQVGQLLKFIIAAGYDIRKLELFRLDETAAAEFLEVYRGVVQSFHLIVEEMCSGPVIAMELGFSACHSKSRGSDNGGNTSKNDCDCVVSTFRKNVAGPYDISMAKELYPDTIRGRFGIDNVRNAIHCTDLPSNSQEESDFFFNIFKKGSV